MIFKIKFAYLTSLDMTDFQNSSKKGLGTENPRSLGI